MVAVFIHKLFLETGMLWNSPRAMYNF